MSSIFKLIFDTGCQVGVNGFLDQGREVVDVLTSGSDEEGLDASVQLACIFLGFLCILMDFLSDL